MKTIICVSVFLLVLLQLCNAVTVKEGDSDYSLESVKALKALMTGNDTSLEQQVQLLEAKAASVCSHPALPKDLRPLCMKRDAGSSLLRLALVAFHADACEICVSVACFGCRNERTSSGHLD